MKHFEKAKGFLMEPTRAFKKEQKTSFGDAFKYFLVLAVIISVLSGVVTGVLAGTAVVFVSVAVVFYIGLIIGLLVWGLILHVFAYIVGARKGLEQTLKAVLYGSTPTLLLGWIPFIGGIFSIWSAVLEIMGLKSLHNISTGRAILAFLIPVIILAALFVMGMLMFLLVFSSMGSIPFTGAMAPGG